jgi:hypothetical protein
MPVVDPILELQYTSGYYSVKQFIASIHAFVRRRPIEST